MRPNNRSLHFSPPLRSAHFLAISILLLNLTLKTTGMNVCRPMALVYCEMPVISSLSKEPYPAFPGEEFRVECQAYGSPTPLITWYRVLPDNGESLIIPSTPGHHMMNDAGILRIQHVVPHDDGKFLCIASNSVGDDKAMIEVKHRLDALETSCLKDLSVGTSTKENNSIWWKYYTMERQVSHPLVSLISLEVGDTFVTLTWNGSVHLSALHDHDSKPTPPSRRHHHHVETRYRLSRHLFLKTRSFTDTASSLTRVTKLESHSKRHTIRSLTPDTVYEFCIEFQPPSRPTTLLDCLILRTTVQKDRYVEQSYGIGYHDGHAIVFILLIAIVVSVSCMCFGCYAVAIGKKLIKYKNKKGFSALGYTEELHDENNPAYPYVYREMDPRKPLIARI